LNNRITTLSLFNGKAWAWLAGWMLLLCLSCALPVQAANPAPDTVCVASALNRNTTVQGGSYYMIPGVPSQLGNYRIRAVCNDGTVGQTGIVKPAGGAAFVAGPIQWGVSTPIPRSLQVDGSGNVSYGQAVQLKVTAKGSDGATFDVTSGASGTNYTSSDPQIVSVSADGLLTVNPAPAGADYGRMVIIGVTNEGTAASRLIQIGPRKTLTGRVMQADGVTPVAGAQVTVQLNAPLTVFPVLQTDAAGNFSLPNAAAGDYTFNALVPSSGARGSVQASLPAYNTQPDIIVKLSGQGSLVLVVKDAGGAAVPGAQLVLAHEQYAGLVRSVQTGANGEAVVPAFTAGPINVSVRDPATGAVATARGELRNGAQLRLTLQLQPTAAIAGHVLDGSLPQMGIQVRLLSDKRGLVSQGASGADGSFRFDSLLLADAPYTLQAVKEGRVQGSVGNLVLAAGQQLSQDIVLGNIAAAGSVTGKVVDAQGQILANLDVSLVASDGRQFGARSDAQGRYRIDGVPLGAFTVSATLGNAGAAVGGVLGDNGAVVTADLQLVASGLVSGRLLLPDGQPAAGVAVVLRHAQAGQRQARTDQDGKFNFGTVPLGLYALSAQRENGEQVLLPSALTQANEVRSHTLRLLAVTALTVQLTEKGQPAANTRVALALQGALPYGAEVLTDANGVARFERVPRTAFSVSVQPKTSGAAGARYDGILSKDSETVTMTLEGSRPSYSISGRLLDTAAQPMANQWVRLSTHDMPRNIVLTSPNQKWGELLVLTDADGRFTFRNVDVYDNGLGRLKLDAMIDGRLRARMLLDTPEDGASMEQDLVLFESAAIAVTVHTPQGKPAPGMPLNAGAVDNNLFSDAEFTASSDEDGGYLFMVPTGQRYWSIYSTALDGLQYDSRTLEPVAGAVLAAQFTLTPAPAYAQVRMTQAAYWTNAKVRVNGKEKVSLRGSGTFPYVALAAGNNLVEVVTDYGDVQSQTVTVSETDFVRIVPLQFSFNPALLSVRINTSASTSLANVTVDGYGIGNIFGSNSLDMRAVSVGTHELKVVTDYGDTRTVQLQVNDSDAGQTVQKEFSFNPPQLYVVVAAPSYGTRISVGGKAWRTFSGSDTGVYYGMHPGDNMVEITAPSGKTRSTVVTVGDDDGGKQFSLNLLLEMAQLKVHVNSADQDGWTAVYLDGSYIESVWGRGTTNPRPVSKGQHKITLSDRNGKQVDSFVTIEESQLETTVDVTAGFDPAQMNVGIVNTAPAEVSRISVNGELAGSVTGSGTLNTARLFEGDNQVVAVTASGDTQRSVVHVDELRDGLVVNTGFVFDRLKARSATLGFDGERHLYTVPVQAGDKLSVRLHGAFDNNGQAIKEVQAQVYGADQALKAVGFGSGSTGDYYLTSTQGDLMAVAADSAGNATIAVQGRNNGDHGGYFMSVLLNGQPVAVSDYLDGGKVSGIVRRDDGVTPLAGATVALRNDGGIGQHLRTVSDADGKFSFDHALAGEPVLAGIASETVVATVPLQLAAAQEVQQDLRWPKETGLQVSVTLPQGVASPGTMPVEVIDLTGSHSVNVVFGGGPTSRTAEVRVLGDSVTLRTSHPQLAGLSAEQTVSGVDNQQVPVELKLRAALARGTVRMGNGMPAAGVAVSVVAVLGNQVYMSTTTDAVGGYTLSLPLGVDVLVRAYDATFDSYSVLPVAAPAGQDLSLPDILLGARATVKGLVRDNGGNVLAGSQVVLAASVNGKPYRAETSSGGDGRFQLDGVPAGVQLDVAVTAGPLKVVRHQNAVAAPSQVLELPDFVFEQGASLNIQVVDGDLKPNEVVWRASIGECGGNKLRVMTATGPASMPDGDHSKLTGLPPGPITVQLFDGCAYEDDAPLAQAAVEIGNQAEYTVKLVVPVVRGTVKYSDGRLVSDPNAGFAQDLAGGKSKSVQNVLQRWETEDSSRIGSFAMAGVELGNYVVSASDRAGHSAEVKGTLDKLQNIKVDLVLPAPEYDHQSSDLVGLVSRDGKPVRGVTVMVEGGDWSRTVRTNDEGGYQFADVPPGPFKVSSQYFYYSAVAEGSAGSDPLVTLDLPLQPGPYDGSASNVKGRVTVDGVGQAGLPLTLSLAGGRFDDSQRVFNTVSGADGAYEFADIPAGDFKLEVVSSWDSAQAVGHAGSAQELTINLAIASAPFDGAASRLQGRITKYDGMSGAPARVMLESGGETLYAQADDDGNYAFERIKAGPFRLSAMFDGAAAEAAGSAGAAPVMTLDLDLIRNNVMYSVRGTVKFSNGELLSDAEVEAYQNGRISRGWLGSEGGFGVSDLFGGPFVLRIEDRASGIAATANGVAAGDGNITLDLVLPVGGTVDGTVTDHRGRIMPGARVTVRSSGLPGLDRYAMAGDDGKYHVEHVMPGQLVIAAHDPQTALLASASLALSSEQKAVQDLAMPTEVAALEGTVLGTDGVTPVPDAAVTFASNRSFELADALWVQARSDGNGKFSLPALTTGAFSLVAADPAQPDLLGVSFGTALSGAPQTLDVQLGTALPARAKLALADGGFYQFECDGALDSGSVGPDNGRSLDYQLRLQVDGVQFPCLPAVAASADKREVIYGPVALKGLQVQRRAFVPESGGFARLLDTFSNTSASSVTVKVRLLAPLPGGSQDVLLAPTQTGYRYALTSHPALAVVLGSAGANQAGNFVLQPAPFRGGDGEGGYVRKLSVAPGASVSVLSYLALSSDAGAASAMAEALAGKQAPAMFDQLTPEQQATIINFKLP